MIVTIPQGVNTTYTMRPYDGSPITFKISTNYIFNPAGYVAMEASLTNLYTSPVVINGAATVISGLKLTDEALFEMPGNIPAHVYSTAGLPNGFTLGGEYASPLIHFMNGDRDINLIFANEYEKWMPSVTKDFKGSIDVINLSCTLSKLLPGESLFLGTQFFQLTDSAKGYCAAQNLYTDKGWVAPTDGVKGSPIYSGHPAGVSDNDFTGAEGTLDEYKNKLETIKSLGFNSFWMLPVFEHPASEGSIYLPYNMENIDSRYSNRVKDEKPVSLDEQRTLAYEEMKDFGNTVSALGMDFMIDYVPHGPYRYNPNEIIDEGNVYLNPWLTDEKEGWIATQRGFDESSPISHRYEWNAYAFDFANEDYLEYMYHLAKKQAEDFSLTGTRIDAVMGSLPNWSPYKTIGPAKQVYTAALK